MSLRFSGEQEKCGRNVYEFSAFNPGVGVCQTYSNFPINSSSYTEQLNPFLSQKRKDKEEEDGRILGWYLLDLGFKSYNSTK